MRHIPPSFDATVSAFREMTAMPGEGDATRARVLARAGREARRRSLLRRRAVPVVVGMAVLCFCAALTAAGLRWRAPAPAGITSSVDEPRSTRVGGVRRPTRIVPALRAGSAPPALSREDGEKLAYERAHRAHFFADAPAAAVAAWDAYLAAHPHGTFAPEARYNRALGLVRLGRLAEAADGLRPFAAGRLGGYRRQEACRLLGWLSEQDTRLRLPPHCAPGN